MGSLCRVIWWRHQMETYSALLVICAGNLPVPDEFCVQRPVTRSLVSSLIYARINGWVNNREAGDLKRHRAHYDVIVMRNKIMYVVPWWTVYKHTRMLIWCLFPSLLHNSSKKHQNNTLVSAWTVRSPSPYNIIYIFSICIFCCQQHNT